MTGPSTWRSSEDSTVAGPYYDPYRTTERSDLLPEDTMSTPSTQTTDRTDHGRGQTSGARSLATELISTARNRDRPGSTAVVAGGTLLVRALRTFRRNRRRAAIQALIGGALVAFGLRQSRSASETAPDRGATSSVTTGGSGESMVDKARSAADRIGIGSGDVNPRGVSNEPDVETKTDPDEGPVQFRTDQDAGPRSKPHLDGAGADDPRRHEEDDEVDVDISDAALADEASEATGPDPEQAQPASTEGTEPEPTPEEDVSHVEADEPIDADETAGDADETSGTDGSEFAEEALDKETSVDAVSEPDGDDEGEDEA